MWTAQCVKTAEAEVVKSTSNSIGSLLAGAGVAAHGLRTILLPTDADLVILRVCLDSGCNACRR